MLLAQLSDPHVALRPLQGVVDTAAAFARCVASVLALDPQPDAVLLSGDLVESGAAPEYALVRDLIAPLAARMPIYPMVGNHDLHAPLRTAFAGHPGMPRSGFLQYAADVGAVRLVVCDTVVPGAGHGALCAERLAWIEATLASAPDRPTILALHHPPFATGIVFMDRLGLRVGAPELAAILARRRQVQRVVCGHVHRSIVADFGTCIAMSAPGTAHQIPTAFGADEPEAFVLEPPGWLLHRWDGARMNSYLMPVAPGAPRHAYA